MITGKTRSTNDIRRFGNAYNWLIFYRFVCDYYVWIFYICAYYDSIENISLFASLLNLYVIMCGLVLPCGFAFVLTKWLKHETSYNAPNQIDIYRMAKNGDIAAFEELDAYGMELDLLEKQAFYQCTVLHCAVSTLKHQMVEYLLCKAPDLIYINDKEHDTPLHYCCRYSGNKTIAAVAVMLLKTGKVNVNAKNRAGNTPLV